MTAQADARRALRQALAAPGRQTHPAFVGLVTKPSGAKVEVRWRDTSVRVLGRRQDRIHVDEPE